MAKIDWSSENTGKNTRADIGTIPGCLKKVRRYYKKSISDQDNLVDWDKSRYSAALFGFLFFVIA